MEKIYKSSFFIFALVFILIYVIILSAVFLAGEFSLKLNLYLFFATLISYMLTATILGGYFTSLSSHLFQLRRVFRLDNLNHPLLLRLSSEAPGTYHHSILVANLAAKAAKSIGADSLLCRVAAHFHDIGKLKNPDFFIENQASSKNNNFQIPSESFVKSAQKIIGHLEEGIKMAQEAHLPKEVVSVIAQHHGTSLPKYYYNKAKNQNPGVTKKAFFRYKGPKPQTKEAAILMLADNIEAISRREKDNLVKEANFERLVSSIINEKEDEKQLTDCNLTRGELLKLEKSFTKSLLSMFHPRIKYS